MSAKNTLHLQPGSKIATCKISERSYLDVYQRILAERGVDLVIRDTSDELVNLLEGGDHFDALRIGDMPDETDDLRGPDALKVLRNRPELLAAANNTVVISIIFPDVRYRENMRALLEAAPGANIIFFRGEDEPDFLEDVTMRDLVQSPAGLLDPESDAFDRYRWQ